MPTRSRGLVFTFYSYKGGTGRSMALANVAWILASNGRRVLAIDWDLEAPGLHRYFAPFLLDPGLTSTTGLIDFVADYATLAMTPPPDGRKPPDDWYVKHADITPYATSLRWRFRDQGTIDFVPAGRQGPGYGKLVNSFAWDAFYENLGGRGFLDAARAQMIAEYDYVLIDSRTGVSDTSGICTIQMPDCLVTCFTLNNQGIQGAAEIARTSVQQRPPDRPMDVFPVPMRVDPFEKDRLERRMKYAHRQFAEFGRDSGYWGEVEIPYVPYYAYEEILAAFGDQPGRVTSALAAFERLTAHLTRKDVLAVVPPDEKQRAEVLALFERTPGEEPVAETAAALVVPWRAALWPAAFGALVVAFMVGIWIFAAALRGQSRNNAIVGAARNAIAETIDGGRNPEFNPLRAALLLAQLTQLPNDATRAGAVVAAREVLQANFAAVAIPTPSPVGAMDFTVDGSSLVTGHENGVVRVWDAGSGQVLKELTGHTNRVVSAAFDAQGSRVVTTSADGTLRIWNLATSQEQSSVSLQTLAKDCGRSSAFRAARFIADSADVAATAVGAIYVIRNGTQCEARPQGDRGTYVLNGNATLAGASDVMGNSLNLMLERLPGPNSGLVYSIGVVSNPDTTVIGLDLNGRRALVQYSQTVDVFDLASGGRLTLIGAGTTTDAGTAILDDAGGHVALGNARGVEIRPVTGGAPQELFGPTPAAARGSRVQQSRTAVLAFGRRGNLVAKALDVIVEPSNRGGDRDLVAKALLMKDNDALTAQPIGPYRTGVVYIWRLTQAPLPENPTWSTLQAAIRTRTTYVCLSAVDRERYLGQSSDLADAAQWACEAPRLRPAIK